jgi:hypothetical protein
VGERDGDFMGGVGEGDASTTALTAEGAGVTTTPSTRSGAVVLIVVIAARRSAPMSRMPSTSPVRAAYILAAACAVMVPAHGTSARR